MSLEQKLINAIKWSAVSKFLSQLINWCFTFLTIRLLTPDDYGLFAIVLASLSLFALINEFGLGAALVQTKELTNEQIKSANGLIISINIVIFSIVLLISSPLSVFLGDQRLASLLDMAAIQFLLSAPAVVPRSLLIRNIDFKNKEIIFAIKGFIAAFSTYILALQGYGVWSLVYGALLSSTFATFTLNIVIKRFYFPSLSLAPIRPLLGFSINMLTQRTLWWLYTQADVFILKKIFTSSVVGIFFTAKHLASMPQDKLSAIINDIVLTGFSKIKDDIVKVRKQTLRLLSMLATIIFPIYYGIAATSEIFIPLLIGEQWLEAIKPLFLLCLIYPLRMLNAPIAEVLNALGFTKVNITGLIVNSTIMLTSILIGAQWGILGVCYAWIIGYSIAFVLFTIIASKHTGITLFSIIKSILPAFLSSVVMLIAVQGLFHYLLIEVSIFSFIISALTGAITYLSLIFITNKSTCKDIIYFIKK